MYGKQLPVRLQRRVPDVVLPVALQTVTVGLQQIVSAQRDVEYVEQRKANRYRIPGRRQPVPV